MKYDPRVESKESLVHAAEHMNVLGQGHTETTKLPAYNSKTRYNYVGTKFTRFFLLREASERDRFVEVLFFFLII